MCKYARTYLNALVTSRFRIFLTLCRHPFAILDLKAWAPLSWSCGLFRHLGCEGVNSTIFIMWTFLQSWIWILWVPLLEHVVSPILDLITWFWIFTPFLWLPFTPSTEWKSNFQNYRDRGSNSGPFEWKSMTLPYWLNWIVSHKTRYDPFMCKVFP